MTETCLATKVAAMPLSVKAEGAPGVFEGYGAVFGNRDRELDSTLVTITHRKYDNHVIDDLPQRQVSFTIAVS